VERALLLTSALAIAGSIAVAGAQTSSPYAGQEQRSIKALSDDEIRDLREARGMGLAKAAELNSYPGPLHVLQLGTELGLTDTQRAATEVLYGDMRDKAQGIGRKIIDAERELDQAFANGTITADALRAHLGAVGLLRSELRTVHLATHLTQHALLTPEQIVHYNELRGYFGPSGPHARSGHSGSKSERQTNEHPH
jgi:Spy/CpxP family protein refolding chaperone